MDTPSSFSYLSRYPTQSYAPIRSFETPLQSSINLDEEVKLYNNKRERQKYENLSDLFAIIVSLDYLEKAYVRDAIKEDEYTPACLRLLAQYKTIQKVDPDVPAVEAFMREYKMDYPAASYRMGVGVPSTVEHSLKGLSSANASQQDQRKHVAEATQHFITLMDALRLGRTAKDELQPLLNDLVTSLADISGLGDFEGKSKIITWLVELNKMRASDEISQEQTRQMLFDLEGGYSNFMRWLGGKA